MRQASVPAGMDGDVVSAQRRHEMSDPTAATAYVKGLLRGMDFVAELSRGERPASDALTSGYTGPTSRLMVPLEVPCELALRLYRLETVYGEILAHVWTGAVSG